MSNVVVPRLAVEAVLKQTGRFVKPVVEPKLIKEFRKIKEEMLSEFDNHSATQELVGKQAQFRARLFLTEACLVLLALMKAIAQQK